MVEILEDITTFSDSEEITQTTEKSRFNGLGRQILHPIETFRTAPLAVIGEGVGTVVLLDYVAETIHRPDLWNASFSVGFAILAAKSAGLVNHHLRLRDRIESNVARRSFDERFFEPLTDEWCVRQTVNVALEDTGFADQFRELCDRRRETAEFSEIPHF
jgi:hypothetical protein